MYGRELGIINDCLQISWGVILCTICYLFEVDVSLQLEIGTHLMQDVNTLIA